MKRCHKCRRRYSDDSLNFCLDDGSQLLAEPDSDPTVVAPPVTIPFISRSTAVPSTPAPSSHSPFRWVLLAAIVLLAVILGGGAVAFLYRINNWDSRIEGRTSATPTATPETKTLKPIESKSPSTRVERTSSQVPNLTGEWRMVNTIENTSYPAYANLRIGYRLAINQSGSDFTATGEKTTENGRAMEDFERTPMKVTGSVDQGSATASFVEEGLRRRTTGKFVWTISADGNQLRGTFVSTAAKSSGLSVATRER